MEKTKLARSAAVIDRILKIVQGFAVAGVIVAAIFIPLTLIFGQKIIADASHVQLGVLKVTLAGDAAGYLDIPRIKLSIVCVLICAIFASAAAWYCIRVLREILVPMKDGSPFAAGISGKVRKLGWTVLVGGCVVELGRMLSEAFEMMAYDVSRLLNTDLVASVTYNINMDLWFVFAALILFFLSYVFRYGEELQRESDETL